MYPPSIYTCVYLQYVPPHQYIHVYIYTVMPFFASRFFHHRRAEPSGKNNDLTFLAMYIHVVRQPYNYPVPVD